MVDPFEILVEVLTEAGIDYALIGGHAVNAWLEPRFTMDIDVTVTAGPDQIDRLRKLLADRRFVLDAEYGADQPRSVPKLSR